MSTGSVAEHDSPSDDDESEHGFVTKRTFELLEQDEPYCIERQLMSLATSGIERCFRWSEVIKEVVEPMTPEAEIGVDCVKDLIRMDWAPQFVRKQRLMVGPAVHDFAAKTFQNFSTTNLLTPVPCLRNDVSLSSEPQSSIKEPNKLMVWQMSTSQDDSTHNSIVPSTNTRSHASCTKRSGSRQSKLIAQKKIPGRETACIVRNHLMNTPLKKTVFDRYVEAESMNKIIEAQKRLDEEYESIASGRVFLVPVSDPDSAKEHGGSGKRPESPIILDDYADDEDREDPESLIDDDPTDANFPHSDQDEYADDEDREGPGSSVDDDPIDANDVRGTREPPEIVPKPSQQPIQARNMDKREPENVRSIHAASNKYLENESEAEVRDPCPTTDNNDCDDDAPASRYQSRYQTSVDYSFLETLPTDSRFSRSKSLLHRMRAQNRKLDRLSEQLKDFASMYTFGESDDGLSTDHSATYSSRDSSFFASTSHQKPGVNLSKRSSHRFDDKSPVSSSDGQTNGDSSIANSSIDSDGDRDESQNTCHQELISSTDRASSSGKKVENDIQEATNVFRIRPYLGPRFRSNPAHSKMY